MFADALLKDPDLVFLHTWITEKKPPTSEEIAGFTARVKELAQIADQTCIQEEVF